MQALASAGYGRADCLKDMPGQCIAGDKTGRAIMIASIESQFVAHTVETHSTALTNTQNVANDKIAVSEDLAWMELKALTCVQPLQSRHKHDTDSGGPAPQVCFALIAQEIGSACTTPTLKRFFLYLIFGL